MRSVTILTTLVSACFAFSSAAPVAADVICVKKTVTTGSSIRLPKTIKKVVGSRCPSGFSVLVNTSSFAGAVGAVGATGAIGATGTTGPTGAAGTNGSSGADGSIRIYGDGSAGELVVSTNTFLTVQNLQFTNVTIDASQTLTVSSGSVIRCSGTFTNNGTISVSQHAYGAYISTDTPPVGTLPPISNAHPGIGVVVAGQPGFGTSGNIVEGGIVGVGLTASAAARILNPGPLGGGGGGAGINFQGGGKGGGTITVLANGEIINTGTIFANGLSGGTGSGGGGGGIVILASKSLVTNSGNINVAGGAGGASSILSGAGGGGGGGLIHLLSTSAPINSGSTTVTGGLGGSGAIAVTTSPRTGGGGGGSMVGAGGKGGSVNTSDVSAAGTSGGNGALVTSTLDPTSLF